jgi:hypothetical protein
LWVRVILKGHLYSITCGLLYLKASNTRLSPSYVSDHSCFFFHLISLTLPREHSLFLKVHVTRLGSHG